MPSYDEVGTPEEVEIPIAMPVISCREFAPLQSFYYRDSDSAALIEVGAFGLCSSFLGLTCITSSLFDFTKAISSASYDCV